MHHRSVFTIACLVFGPFHAGWAQDDGEIRIDKGRFKDTPLRITEVVRGNEVPDIWQTGPYCGANSLYVLLQLCHSDVSHAKVKQAVKTTDEGANLLELKNAAIGLGLDCELVEASPSRFREIPLPFIALLGGKKDRKVSGHYVVVYDIGDDSIMAVDGTTGHKDRYTKTVFFKSYSGYLLHPRVGKILGASDSDGRRTIALDATLALANVFVLIWQIAILLKRLTR